MGGLFLGFGCTTLYEAKVICTGKGVTQDYTEAAKWYRKAADQGFAQAQFNLGLMYANGKGVTRDDTEAAMWYAKAADQGLADAKINLALLYAKSPQATLQ